MGSRIYPSTVEGCTSERGREGGLVGLVAARGPVWELGVALILSGGWGAYSLVVASCLEARLPLPAGDRLLSPAAPPTFQRNEGGPPYSPCPHPSL